MQINEKEIKNILLVRNDRFGEFLLNIPAFRALKQKYRLAKLTLITSGYNVELAQCIESIDEIIPWENKKHTFKEIFQFIRELKKRRFGLCVIFNPSKEFNLISFLAGIPLRVGYDRKWGFLLNRKKEDKKQPEEKHEIEYNIELAELAGGSTNDKTLSLKIDGGEKDGFFEKLGIKKENNPIALHPWTSDPIKQWPVENFLELSLKITKELNIPVIIIGGKNESEESQRYFSGLNGNITDTTGKTSLKELAVLLKNCRLLISGDSGPVHLASSLNIPVIAIFRNDLAGKGPARWGPLSKESIIIDKPALIKITVEEVFKKVEGALKK